MTSGSSRLSAKLGKLACFLSESCLSFPFFHHHSRLIRTQARTPANPPILPTRLEICITPNLQNHSPEVHQLWQQRYPVGDCHFRMVAKSSCDFVFGLPCFGLPLHRRPALGMTHSSLPDEFNGELLRAFLRCCCWCIHQSQHQR
jgi:hypothetical protein